MNTPALLPDWLPVLAFLAAEVALLALGLELLQRARPSGAWRRAVWQTGVAGMLPLVAVELSGGGSALAGWVAGRPSGPSSSASSPMLSVPPPLLEKVADKVVDKVTTGATLASSGGGDQGEGEPPPNLPGTTHASRNTHHVPGEVAARSYSDPQLPSDSLSILSLGLIWGSGALLVGGRAALARCLFFWFRCRRRPVADLALAQRVERLARALGLARRVRLLESPRLASPIAFGIVTPTIGLPSGFSQRFEPTRQEAMLAHELAHLRAGDPFWCLVADLATAALWWHPAAWWMRRQFHLAGELAADEASLLLHDGPRVLAECLVELGGRLAPAHFPGELRAAGYRSHLGRRVQRLLHLEGPWAPPPRRASALLRGLGPLALVGLVILAGAWVAPRASITKGNSMKQNWKRSLATLTLLATVNVPHTMLAQAAPATPAPPATPTIPNPPAPPANPQMPGMPAPPAAPAEAFARRYGLGASAASRAAAPLPDASGHSARLEAKLNGLVLEQVSFDGLPLSEVLKYLSDESCKRDPEKKGLNFLINPNGPATTAPAPIVDPTTGLPAAAPAEALDMSAVIIKFNLPLRHVTLKNVLDAIVTVADHPIEYSLEDYGVVFAPARAAFSFPSASRAAPAPALLARTFKVDTNTFVPGLESTFGIKVETSATNSTSARSREVQSALKLLLMQLGVVLDGNKSIFFNELTGLLLVRATAEDQELITAAIETLGGSIATSYGDTGGGMAGWAPGRGR